MSKAARQLQRSLAFTKVIAYLPFKHYLKFQSLSRYFYKVGIPRAIYLVPFGQNDPLFLSAEFGANGQVLGYNIEKGQFYSKRVKDFQTSQQVAFGPAD